MLYSKTINIYDLWKLSELYYYTYGSGKFRTGIRNLNLVPYCSETEFYKNINILVTVMRTRNIWVPFFNPFKSYTIGEMDIWYIIKDINVNISIRVLGMNGSGICLRQMGLVPCFLKASMSGYCQYSITCCICIFLLFLSCTDSCSYHF